jgi:Na+/H+ antiporter NhaD/arsenite permease-like protein
VKTGVLSGVFSSLANNLPSTLGFAAALGRDKINILWPVLVGTNIGSLLLPGGSLAIMLWLSTLKRLDAEVSGMNYIKYAWRIALPTFLVALGGLLLIRL